MGLYRPPHKSPLKQKKGEKRCYFTGSTMLLLGARYVYICPLSPFGDMINDLTTRPRRWEGCARDTQKTLSTQLMRIATNTHRSKVQIEYPLRLAINERHLRRDHVE